MELKILSGNNVAEASQKAADDDMYNDILEKYAVTDKNNADKRVLSRETALEACTELYS